MFECVATDFEDNVKRISRGKRAGSATGSLFSEVAAVLVVMFPIGFKELELIAVTDTHEKSEVQEKRHDEHG